MCQKTAGLSLPQNVEVVNFSATLLLLLFDCRCGLFVSHLEMEMNEGHAVSLIIIINNRALPTCAVWALWQDN